VPGAGARAAAAAARTTLLIARAVRLVVAVITLIVALGIAFVVLGANRGNTVVHHVHDWAKTLVGPFDGIFHLHGAKATLALNWGIGLIVWLIIGSLVVRIVLMPAWSLRRRRRAV
jgi:hypothetical protein